MRVASGDGGGKISDDVDEVTKKYGLEAGLWKVLTAKNGEEGNKAAGPGKGSQAKELLKRYGSAYLITSISLSVVSFGLCYLLVSAGVDVAALLQRIGIDSTSTSEKVGTVAIAYTTHKGLSPIRFPPTVALTPIVARLLGREVAEEKPAAVAEDTGEDTGTQ